MLIGEQLAAASHTALYFIQHQQRLMLIAKLAQSLHEFLRRRHDAALALNRFNHDGAGVIINHRFHGVQIIERHVDNIRRFRAESIRIFWLAADRNSKQRPAMKSVMKRDDLAFERAVTFTGVVTRQLKRSFVGFGTGVGEEDALGKGRLNELTGKT